MKAGSSIGAEARHRVACSMLFVTPEVMFRLIALAFVMFVCSACRYWSGADSVRVQSEPIARPQQSPPDDWQDGRLPQTRTDEVPRRGGEIVVRINSEPPSLNVVVDSDWLAAQITEHRVYESLVTVDPYDHPNYRHQPSLAERWAISADQLVYTLWLRQGVFWHDGRPFTSRDVVATFDKVQDPSTKAMHIRAYTRELAAYRALDDYTVEFRFKRPYFLVLDGIFVEVPILPAHVIANLTGSQFNESASNPLNRHPIGTGPFRFDSWVSNQSISLVRNPSYWARAPYLDRVTFRIVKDAAVAMELANRQDLDVVTRLRAEQWVNMDQLRLGSHYNRSLFYEPNYSWIGYNQNRRLFRDRRVRRAMTMLIDRPGIIKALQHGLARPTTCHFYLESPACDPTLEPLTYDPVAAIALLDAAGWRLEPGESVRSRERERFGFSLMIPASSDESARTATLIKESLMRAGIDMRLQRVEWSAFVRRLRDHDFDACTLAWASSSPRGDPTQVWHSSSIAGGSNYVGFNSPQADALIDAARSEFDDERRNRMYREFGRILHEEQPYTWLYVHPTMTLIHRRIHGVRASLSGWRYEDWWVDQDRQGGKG
jgi:peptide/nickel transport system substrate-binding protein